jgi:hypothetical protein
MRHVSSSMLNTFQACPRKCEHAYIDKRVPVSEAAPLVFGKAFHAALAGWFEKGSIEGAVKVLREGALGLPPDEAAKACALLAHYAPPIAGWKVEAVEKNFSVPIRSPASGRSMAGYRLVGRVDAVGIKPTGERFIIDHKTTSSEIIGFGAYWQALQVDSQMANYCEAFDARGFVYDVIRKPTIKLCGKDNGEDGQPSPDRYQARIEEAIKAAPAEWFQWREFIKADEERTAGRADLYQTVQMLHSCTRRGTWPRNSGACVNRYGTCQYLDVCSGRASIGDDAVFRTKVEEHEELKD